MKVLFTKNSIESLNNTSGKSLLDKLVALKVDRDITFLFQEGTDFSQGLDTYSSSFETLKYPEIDDSDLETQFTAWTNAEQHQNAKLLYSVSSGLADFIISEDLDLISRSEFSNLDDSVYSVLSLYDFLSNLYETKDTPFHRVKDVPLGDIDVSDTFFKSLFGDYGSLGDGFQKWWEKSVSSGRRAWLVKSGPELAGINIYKDLDEDERKLVPDLGEKPFKICTFKTSESYRGFKIGELLLKPAFTRALELGSTSIYLTLFEDKQPDLVQFLVKFGFAMASKKKGNESIMYKLMSPPQDVERMEPFDFHRRYAPFFYDDSEIDKYAIPIRPGYHAELFPDINPVVVKEGESPVVNNVPGNTIKKAYLCNSSVTSLKPGSIILFYRSNDERAITTIGIVEETNLYNYAPSVMKKVTNRTVFSKEQVESMVEKNKGCVTITFRLVKHLSTFITCNEMVKHGALNGPPMSITGISNEGYEKLKESYTELSDYSSS